MTPDPVTISLETTVQEAASLLTVRGVSAAPVVNVEYRPVATISRADIARHAGRAAEGSRAACEFFEVDELVSWSASDRLTAIVPDLPGRTRLHRLMDRRIHRIRHDAPAVRVVEELLARRVQRLMVVDDEGRLIGTVDALDVLRNLRR